MILGKLKNVYAFSLLPDVDPEVYLQKVKKKLDSMSEDSIIITDLFGGTPSNIAAMLSKDYRISAVSGLNMSMLIEAVMLRERIKGEELAEAVISAGKEGCENIIASLNTIQERKE